MEQVAASSNHIQIVSDGSSNIAKERVENVSFLVNGVSYYWKSTSIGATTAGANWTVDHVIQNALEITINNLKR